MIIMDYQIHVRQSTNLALQIASRYFITHNIKYSFHSILIIRCDCYFRLWNILYLKRDFIFGMMNKIENVSRKIPVQH